MLVVVLNVLGGSIGFLSRDDDAIFLKHTSLFELVNLNAYSLFYLCDVKVWDLNTAFSYEKYRAICCQN